MRIPRVDHDGDPGRPEWEGILALRKRRVVCPHLFLRGGGERAVHDGDVHSGFHEDSAAGEDAGGALAAFGTEPGIAQESRSGRGSGGRGGRAGGVHGFDGFEGEDNVILEVLDPIGHADTHGILPMSARMVLVIGKRTDLRVVLLVSFGGIPWLSMCIHEVDHGRSIASQLTLRMVNTDICCVRRRRHTESPAALAPLRTSTMTPMATPAAAVMIRGFRGGRGDSGGGRDVYARRETRSVADVRVRPHHE